MTLADFQSAGELKDFVIDNSIPQANIVSINFAGGRWYLFYWV